MSAVERPFCFAVADNEDTWCGGHCGWGYGSGNVRREDRSLSRRKVFEWSGRFEVACCRVF